MTINPRAKKYALRAGLTTLLVITWALSRGLMQEGARMEAAYIAAGGAGAVVGLVAAALGGTLGWIVDALVRRRAV
jgi:hypothetical protein